MNCATGQFPWRAYLPEIRNREIMGSHEQGADATENRWLTIPRTLCFILNEGDILLMKRASHKRIFPNRYNGVGGHIERDEDPLTSARREIYEETGLHIKEMQLRAVYNIDAGANSGIILFVFVGYSAERVTIPNTEGSLHWIPLAEVESLDLVEDLPHILPRVLQMQPGESPFFVHASYDAGDHLLMKFAE